MKVIENQHPSVLMVVTLFGIGGATETVVSLAAGLKEKGYKVDIVAGLPIASEGDMYEEAKKQGISVLTLKSMVRDIHLYKDLVTLLFLVRTLRKNKYDIVHTHSSKAGVLGRIAGWMARVPVVVHTIHGLPYHQYQNILIRSMYIWVEKICAFVSTAIVTVTYAIIRSCVQNGIGAQEKFVMIRSCFNTKQYTSSIPKRKSIRQRYGFDDNDIVAGTISRLALLKGHEYIIDIAERLCVEYPHLKFFFVGDGELRDDLQKKIASLRLDNNVVFSGLVEPRAIPEVISAMDFIIHPSLREGLARVIPQAIIMGKKVVTFEIDGVDEIIVQGETGFCISPKNTTQLYETCKLLCDSPPEYLVVGEEYRRKVAVEFDVGTMVHETDILYERLLRGA